MRSRQPTDERPDRVLQPWQGLPGRTLIRPSPIKEGILAHGFDVQAFRDHGDPNGSRPKSPIQTHDQINHVLEW